VTVYTLEIVGEAASQVTLRCVCSGGTYVRTIAHDLGRKVGCGGHVVALTRTAVGRFRLQDATTIDQASEQDFIPLANALEPMPIIRLREGQARIIQHGNFLRYDNPPNEPLAALADDGGRVFSVARVVENELHPECVLPLEALDGAI
jgi:tRNA pseudouridine55 synthase